MTDKKIKALHKKAEEGDAEALGTLGYAYFTGEGVQQDEKRGREFFQQAAESGDPRIMGRIGQFYLTGGINEEGKGISLLQKAADAGDIQSKVVLGTTYFTGVGAEQDKGEGSRLLQEAVEAGDTGAKTVFGYALLMGIDVQQNADKGSRLLQEAADAGNTMAKSTLGWAYIMGQEIEEDLDKGYRLLQEAADAGEMVATGILGDRYLTGSSTEQDIDKSIKLLQAAAEAGVKTAMVVLGGAYLLGKQIDRDVEKGLNLFKKLKESGDAIGIVVVMFVEFWKSAALDFDEEFSELLDIIYKISHEVEDIISSKHSAENKIVYHYTDIKSIRSMVSSTDSNVLRLYNPSYFNDPEEGSMFSKSCSIIKYFYGEGEGDDESARERHPHMTNFEGRELSFHICSFSERADKLYMWRGYGQDGDGYSISIIVPSRLQSHWLKKSNHIIIEGARDILGSQPSSKGSEINEQIPIRKVLYGIDSVMDAIGIDGKNECKEGSLAKLLNDLKEKIHGSKPSIEKFVKSIVVGILGDLRYLYKEQVYEYEDEFRIVRVVPLDSDNLKLDESLNPPRLYVETSPFLFEKKGNKIIIGPRVSNKDAVELLIHHMLAKRGWDKTTEVTHSKIKNR